MANQECIICTVPIYGNIFENPLSFNPRRHNLDHSLFLIDLRKISTNMDANGYVNQDRLKQPRICVVGVQEDM
jgi:hypothetical protein